jgi:hypothetical protein
MAFSPRVLAKTPFGILCAHLLQPLAAGMVASASVLDLSTAEGLALTICSQIDAAQINAQCPVVWFGWFRLWRRLTALSDMQVVDATPPNQIGPANFPRRVYQHSVLTRSNYQTADNAAIQGVERHPVKAHQAIGACVVAHTATWAKLWTRLAMLSFHRFDGCNCFRSGTDRQLRAQPKVQAGFAVHSVVGCVSIGDPLIPAHPRNPGSRFIEGALRRSQNHVVAANVQLDTGCSDECFVHKDRCYLRDLATERRRRLLPIAEARGLRAGGR